MKTYRSENQHGEGCGHQHRRMGAAELCRRRKRQDSTLMASEDGGRTWRKLDQREQRTCKLLWGNARK